jgi:hypothetical protein
MKRRLPIVTEATFDKIDIATPCHVEWDQMDGDERVRHCGDCRLFVYNVAEMTRAEAATLIATNEGGRTCLRLYRRPDGTLLTADCWARLRAARQRGWIAFAAALVIVGLTQLGLRFAALGWLIQWSTAERPPIVETAPILEPPPPPPVLDPEPGDRVRTMGIVGGPPPTEKTTTKKKTTTTTKGPQRGRVPVVMGIMAAPSDGK